MQCAYKEVNTHMKCVVSSMVRFCLCFISRSQVALRAYGSIPDVGSSRITTSDPPIRAMPTLNRQETRQQAVIMVRVKVVDILYRDMHRTSASSSFHQKAEKIGS